VTFGSYSLPYFVLSPPNVQATELAESDLKRRLDPLHGYTLSPGCIAGIVTNFVSQYMNMMFR